VALFLSFTKRRADVVAGLTPAHRPALAGYNAAFLELAMGITCGITLLAYALYSMDTKEFLPGLRGLRAVAGPAPGVHGEPWGVARGRGAAQPVAAGVRGGVARGDGVELGVVVVRAAQAGCVALAQHIE
jgi:hypothetical protein